MIRLPVNQDKNSIREHFLTIRDNLNLEEVRLKSELITEKIFNLEIFQVTDIIHSYVSIANRNEVDTFNIIETALTQNKRVVVPKMKSGGRLNHVEIHSLKDLKKNKWGISEPENDDPFDTSNLGIIIVPMVAGDEKKNRIGYGQGYYDRFLSKTNAFKIGILFENQISSHPLPIQAFDIPLDILVSEKRIIQ